MLPFIIMFSLYALVIIGLLSGKYIVHLCMAKEHAKENGFKTKFISYRKFRKLFLEHTDYWQAAEFKGTFLMVRPNMDEPYEKFCQWIALYPMFYIHASIYCINGISYKFITPLGHKLAINFLNKEYEYVMKGNHSPEGSPISYEPLYEKYTGLLSYVVHSKEYTTFADKIRL